MLPSSVRRVVAAAPHSPLASSFAAASAVSSTARICVARPGHQRRCSSSKPSSSSSGGAKDIPGGNQAVPANASSRSTEKRKRKAKEAVEPVQSPKLPSVPSTQHLSQEALGLATFFSLHRPISITHSLPRTVSDTEFASLFEPRTKASRRNEVITTLSRTAEGLDFAMAKMAISGQSDADAAGDQVHKVELQFADASEGGHIELNTMAGQFLPFRPPPPPQSQSEVPADSEAASEMAAAEEGALDAADATSSRVYKAMFTIEESIDQDGQVRIVAHSPQILNAEEHVTVEQQEQQAQPRPFLERMALRQLRFDAARSAANGGVYHAISVRRQKRLKVKKKKFKKLMRRTRNLRRKLDRL